MIERKMSVYVIKSAMNICKIGISLDPEARLRGLLTAHGLGLEIVHLETVEASHAPLIERAAHKMLDKVRSNGEWFRVSEEKAIHAVRVATWIVSDCRQAFKREPKALVKKARKPASRSVKWQGDSEALKKWVEENIRALPGKRLAAGKLYDDYATDCREKGIEQVSLFSFGTILPALGYAKVKTGGRIWYKDVARNDDPTLKLKVVTNT